MKNEKGFTLLEIMIAMTISLIALLAVSELYINTKKTSNLQSMQNRVSEDGRYTLFMLQKIIGQSGFRPNPKEAMITDRLTSISSESITVKYKSDGLNQIICDGSVDTLNNENTIIISKSENKLQCNTISWIAPSVSGTGNGTELIDFKIKYGIDTGPINTNSVYGCGIEAGDGSKNRDCIADNYVNELPIAVSPDQIVSIKICLILRSEKKNASIVKTSKVKDCNDNDIDQSQNDKKIYRMFNTTIQLRNS